MKLILTIAMMTLGSLTLCAQSKDKSPEWLASTASHIPLDGELPYYDSLVMPNESFNREKLEENATYYFEKLFGSVSVKSDAQHHKFAGYGTYIFSINKKSIEPAFLYQVYYTLDIHVKGKRYYFTLHDFKIEHQHSEVSFALLLKNAQDNDAKSKAVLEAFQERNKAIINKMNNTMAIENIPLQQTASNW